MRIFTRQEIEKAVAATDVTAALEGGFVAYLIVTTTASRSALLHAVDIRPGTHITTVGADAPGKQELDPEIFRRTQIRAVDSRSQCFDHGDAVHALQARSVKESELVELGEIISNPTLGRTREEQISIVDLTGRAIQDIEIAKLACRQLMRA